VTVEVQDVLFTHSSGNRMSTVRILEGGGVSIRIKNNATGVVNPDEYSYADRIALARFLLQGTDFDPKYRLADFLAGFGLEIVPSAAPDGR
jgi:hypothetical protein